MPSGISRYRSGVEWKARGICRRLLRQRTAVTNFNKPGKTGGIDVRHCKGGLVESRS